MMPFKLTKLPNITCRPILLHSHCYGCSPEDPANPCIVLEPPLTSLRTIREGNNNFIGMLLRGFRNFSRRNVSFPLKLG